MHIKANYSDLNMQRIGEYHYISKLNGKLYHLSMGEKGESSNFYNKSDHWVANETESNKLYSNFDRLTAMGIQNSNNNSKWISKRSIDTNISEEQRESNSFLANLSILLARRADLTISTTNRPQSGTMLAVMGLQSIGIHHNWL